MEVNLENPFSSIRFNLSLLVVLVFSIGATADETDGTSLVPTNAKQSRDVDANNPVIEEVVVEGEKIDPFEMTLPDMSRIYSDRSRGSYYFNIGNYEKAYPLLLSAAKNGFKDAQARVGFIVLHGLGGVDKSNIRGVGWMGVASHGDTMPAYRRYFTQLWKEIPAQQVPMMSEVVQKYREKFGSDELQVICRNRRSIDSHISSMDCFFKREYELLTPIDWANIGAAFANGLGFSASIAR